MSTPDPSPRPSADELLAPPPFGVAEATSEQLLPIPTSMEELLEGPVAPLPVVSRAPEEPLPELASPPVPGPPTNTQTNAPGPQSPVPAALAAAPPPATLSLLPLALAAVVVLGLGGLAGWVFTQVGQKPSTPTAAAEQAAAAPAAQSAAQQSPPPAAAPESPPSREDFRGMTFEDRHAVLAATGNTVEVELHVGLDLLQAGEAEDPCRTFADALDTIETSTDPRTYDWALSDAKAPGGDTAVCTGLEARLDALTAPAPAASHPATPSPKRKRSSRKRPRTATPPTPPPAAEPPPAAKPTPAPSVATKLDDGLRGLGD